MEAVVGVDELAPILANPDHPPLLLVRQRNSFSHRLIQLRCLRPVQEVFPAWCNDTVQHLRLTGTPSPALTCSLSYFSGCTFLVAPSVNIILMADLLLE